MQIYETVLSKDLSFQQKKAFIDKIAQMMKNVPSVIEVKLAPIMIEVHSRVMTNSVKNGREQLSAQIDELIQINQEVAEDFTTLQMELSPLLEIEKKLIEVQDQYLDLEEENGFLEDS